MGLDAYLEGQSAFVDPGRCRRRDRRRPPERLTFVPEDELLSTLDARGVGALLLQRVLHLEQVGEVAAGLDANGEVDRLVRVVEDRQLLVEPLADGALANHGELGVDVDGSGAGDEEEARLVVLKIVDRERAQSLAVHREHPLREEARVVGEETGRIGERGLDVTVRVADHERVAVEDLHEPVAHAVVLRA